MSKLENGRASDEDNLTAEIFKHDGSKLIGTLHRLFIRIWEGESVPNDFKDATVVNIYEHKGDRADCKNYREISHLYVADKIMARIIMDRLLPIFED